MSTRISSALFISVCTAVFAVASLMVALPARAATTIDVPSQCSGNAAVLTVTQQITEADTGTHGTWATDTFTETATVYPSTDPAYAYCAVGTIDSGGTFTTTGPNSPENGSTLAAGVTGTITGGETWLIPAGKTIDASITGASYTATPVNAPSQDSKFSNWQNEVFGATTGANTFSFTYVTDADPAITWLNDGGGNSGDITNPTLSTVYVDGSAGSDSNIGSQAAPLKTLSKALSVVPSGGTVTLAGDVTVTAEVTISTPVTIDGGGHTLFAPINNSANDNSNNAGLGIVGVSGSVTVKNLTVDGTGSTKVHGINIFDATNVTLDTVTSKNNSKSGITVNGSTVTVNNITTSGNSWGGINVDLEADATGPTVLTINGTSSHTETGPDIWRDDNSKDVTVNDTNNQYASATYTSGPGVTGTLFGLNSATVGTDSALRAALADTFVSNIILSADITLGSELDITRAVTIDGANHTLKASFGGASVIQITADNVTLKNLVEDATGTTGNRGINIYKVSGILLDSVTASNNTKNGIVVNGSTVTVNNITTSGNGWEAIDVDLGSGVTTQATLTVNGTSIHGESKAAIRIDDTSKVPTPTVVDTNSQYTASTTGTLTDYYLSTKNIKTSTDSQQTVAGAVTVTVDVPAGTVVKGDSTWDGTISAPAATTTTLTLPGVTTSVVSAIAVGSSESDLTFDKGVRLAFAGQAGKLVGWYNHAGTFTEITATCSADTQVAGDALAAGTSCKIDVGADLVVWTKHFSTFVAYTQTATTGSVAGGSGGGGGGGGPIGLVGSTNAVVPAASAGSTGGEVLGAEAYQFTKDLSVGSKGQDVVELQNVLIAEGDLAAGLNTGTFGQLTKAAVVKYQKAHTISPTSGYVGPKTRAVLNTGSEQTTVETSGGAKQTLTDAQVAAILGLLSSFGADQATITNVSHALGK